MFYQRELDLKSILKEKSHFLLGPRQTGKSSWIRESLNPELSINLLKRDEYERFLKYPHQLREVIRALKLKKGSLVVIDEIQKVPELLDEVHLLIEEDGLKFLLTGSSARKLIKAGQNLLGGRAWLQSFHPLTHFEITDFDLIKYLNRGGLPTSYLSKNYELELKNYVSLYIKEEIQNEAVVRKLQNFYRFLDAVSFSNGEEINYNNIASDCEVPARTVQEYVRVLIDTLIAFELKAYKKTKKRRAVARSKIFFFDVGVANALAKRSQIKLKDELFGKAFEHFIIQEVRAINSYKRKNFEMQYWRSTSGYEVDLILSDEIAIEIKSSDRIQDKHLKGLRALKEEKLINRYVLVSRDKIKRETKDGIEIIYWKDFLKSL